MDNLAVIIMAGGAGTRFWPASTAEKPKQFLGLGGERTLLQETYRRIESLVDPGRVLVLTSAAFEGLVQEQLPGLPPGNIVCEPVRRDTAAAVTLGAVLCRRLFGDPVTAVLPSDHLIAPVESFQGTLLSAARAADAEKVLYTFGIPPTRQETGYGYLERGEQVLDDAGRRHFSLLRFVEKPDAKTARAYLEAGNFLWNSGIFVWKASVVLEAVQDLLPDTAGRLEEAASHFGTPRWPEALRSAFEPLARVSVDHGVMEKAGNVRTVEADFRWSDVGGWTALAEFLEADAHGNAARGRTAIRDARDNIVFCADPEETVALLGVSDLIVVRAGSRTLVVPRDRAEEVKKLVEEAGL
jgi:mannose-1-phosphate guanylyltransferase